MSLNNFYCSDAWRNLREIVINERTDADGFIRDEVTGEPILNRYDVILHHKIPLTEGNVNDAGIALNPDNLMVVSHKTHNKIHDKFGYIRKEIYLVHGSPYAGKHTFVRESMSEGDLIVDIDSIWECVSGKNIFSKPQRLNAVVFGVRDYLLDCVRVRRGKWNNAYIIGGYPLVSERDRIRLTYGARGVHIDTPREKCEERVKAALAGAERAQTLEYIDSYWERFRPDTPPVGRKN